jgi:hypothetical protein
MTTINTKKRKSDPSSARPILEPGFHWVGQPPTYKVLQNGVIKVTKAVSHFVSNDEAYGHFILRPTDPNDPKYHNEHMCIICKEWFATSENKTSNIIKHIENVHREVVPYEKMKAGDIAEVTNAWLNDKLDEVIDVNESTTSKKGTSLEEMILSHNSKKLKTVLMESIVTGMLPLGFANENCGGKKLIKYFNKGVIPRGCSRRSIGRELEVKYAENVQLIKETLAICLKKNDCESEQLVDERDPQGWAF